MAILPDVDGTLIEYPAALSVKAMGLSADDFEALVTGIVEPLIAPSKPGKVVASKSSAGKYTSIRVHFVALNQAQLERIYKALRAEPRVLFTL